MQNINTIYLNIIFILKGVQMKYMGSNTHIATFYG